MPYEGLQLVALVECPVFDIFERFAASECLEVNTILESLPIDDSKRISGIYID